MKLTGFLRFQITKEWLKRGRPGLLNDFVKKVCEAKGIVYPKTATNTREKQL
jgi:hypothetical protein